MTGTLASPHPTTTVDVARTYQIRTFGCQMNVHDSERLAGLLDDAGLSGKRVGAAGELADVVVLNTCAVRENADNKLYGHLGWLASKKVANPGMQIAVGGCLAQKDRAEILRRAPWVDVVFGTHNVGSLPALLARSRHNKAAEIEILDALEVFPSSLPARRESAYSAWVSISVGCNNTCTFCIVPSLRGREADRRPGRRARRGADARRRRRPRGHPARRRTSTPTASSSVTGRRSARCCAPAAPSTAWSGSGSPHRIRRTSPTT